MWSPLKSIKVVPINVEKVVRIKVEKAVPIEVEKVVPIGGVQPDDDTFEMHARLKGQGSWNSLKIELLGDHRFSAYLPAIECVERLEFYATARDTGGGVFNDPPSAASGAYVAIGADGQEMLLRDDMEEDTEGWSVESDASLETGEWVRVDPIGTLFGTEQAQPEDDATAGTDAVRAWITQNGSIGGSVGEADVDNGTTRLMSPQLDLSAGDGTITYARWMFESEGTDTLATEVSADNGASWTFVHSTSNTGSSWQSASFVVTDYVTPSDQVRVRWSVGDLGSPSLVEAGIDNLQVDMFVCDNAEPCEGDVDGSGDVGVDDVLAVLAVWGQSTTGPEDVNGDGIITVDDLLVLLANYGPC